MDDYHIMGWQFYVNVTISLNINAAVVSEHVENFSQAEYYRLALEQLNGHSTAMASLGAPPLKVYNLHLSDRYNRMDHFRAQVIWLISSVQEVWFSNLCLSQ